MAGEDHEVRLSWQRRLWQALRTTADPNTMYSEPLTPAKLAKQASFESFDYYKQYPDIYVSHLRARIDARRDEAAASSAYENRGNSALPMTPHEDSAARSMHTRLAMLQYDAEGRHLALRWVLHVIIAVSVAFVAAIISYAVDILDSYRAETLAFVIDSMPFRALGYIAGYFFWVAISMLLVAISAAVVVFLEPAAAGGGIPDVMAYLNGVRLPMAMNIRTFVAKAISCVCAVAGGLPVGLEAPLIHLGAITGAGVTQGRSRTLGFQTSFFEAFRGNKDRRDFITAGAACGVSAAFGAPIGGLLFAMEELASFWDHSLSGQIFLATMICVTVTTIIDSVVVDHRLLGVVSDAAAVLFEVNVTIPLNLASIVPSFFLGGILGVLAAVFTKVNLILIQWRQTHLKPSKLKSFLEPVALVTVYASLMYILTVFSDCREVKPVQDVNNTVHIWGTEDQGRLFRDTCRGEQTYSPLGTLNMGTGKSVIRHLFTRQTAAEFPMYYLFIFFVVYSVFVCLSSGASVAGGLVVPSLVIGAVFGRLYGLLLWYAGSTDVGVPRGYPFADAWMDPGVFALIGAGAFLAGTSRMTMAICVVMVELSAELHYLLPVMVAVVMSKTVADWISEPLYHQMLHLACIPYLPGHLHRPEFEELTAANVMAADVVTLRCRERTEVVLRALNGSTHHAFPVVELVDSEGRPITNSSEHTTSGERTDDSRQVRSKFVGLVTREDLQVYLTLPQLQTDGHDSAGTADAMVADGFGGYLSPGVLAASRLAWPDWVAHKTSLFLHINHHRDWLHASGGGGSGPSSAPSSPIEPPQRARRGGAVATTAAGVGEEPSANAAVQVEPFGSQLHMVDLARLPAVVDLSLIVNRSPWVIPPFFNFRMVYQTFRMMGLRHMVVVDGDVVRGIITRKDLLVETLLRRLQELRSGLANGGDPHCRPSEHDNKVFASAAAHLPAVQPGGSSPTWSTATTGSPARSSDLGRARPPADSAAVNGADNSRSALLEQFFQSDPSRSPQQGPLFSVYGTPKSP